MKKLIALIACACLFGILAANEALAGNKARTTISLNGEWEFDQTKTAFPPKKFTRKIPVPGLIHLAKPRIAEYDKFFVGPKTDELTTSVYFNFLNNSDYTPMYNWYRKSVKIDKELQEQDLFLTIKKSQYVTVVYVNGMLVGRSVECYTPMDFQITDAVKFGQENEILILVGDRAWLPSKAAGGTDKEKKHYLPGIWDDVFITATGKLKVDRALFLPSAKKEQVTVKTLIRSAYPAQMLYYDTNDSCRLEVVIRERKSGKVVSTQSVKGVAKRDDRTYFETELSVKTPNLWTPDTPFLYEGEISVYDRGELSDRYTVNFGIRDFSRSGRMFTLNGEKCYLRGSNITLQRFFEDPECRDLVWDREWVKKLMIDLPKSIDWNAMRICVGIVPDFWYDLCDEYGIMLQNEWLFWQIHGWDAQISDEYMNWIWSDGNHPSIVIWDAMNENWYDYIGNTLIPELKQLDPTRIWDAGFMTADQMGNDEMDEPHTYMALTVMPPEKIDEYFKNNPYNMGDLNYWGKYQSVLDAGVPQLVNEYGWAWLWRDGRPSKLTVGNYTYFLGKDVASPEACRELQAYWLQLETEWLRAERGIAGVLSFCHLTNNYGYTGDWFINDIKDLEVAPVFKWFKHCFAPEAVFIDLVDQRYTKHLDPYKPGQELAFNIVGITDLKKESSGKVTLRLLDENGGEALRQEMDIKIPAYYKRQIANLISLPEKAGGYLMVAEYLPDGKTEPTISRRYIKVGDANTVYRFVDIKP